MYLHRQTRVVTLSKPYVLGPLSVKSHHIPLGSIPCLNYKKARAEEELFKSKLASESAETISISCKNTGNSKAVTEVQFNDDQKGAEDKAKQGLSKSNSKNTPTPPIVKFPMAKISSLGDTKKAKSLSRDEFKKYCSNLFEFKEVKMVSV